MGTTVKEGKSLIYKMMAKYIFEIILVVTFMAVSYGSFTMNNLSEASEIASLSNTDTREIQAAYALNPDGMPELDGQKFLSRGTLLIKNPNRTSKNMNVVLQLRKNEFYKIGDLNVLVDGEKASMGVVMNMDDSYEVILRSLDLDAYESDEMDIAIYSRVGAITVEYSFKIVGSF